MTLATQISSLRAGKLTNKLYIDWEHGRIPSGSIETRFLGNVFILLPSTAIGTSSHSDIADNGGKQWLHVASNLLWLWQTEVNSDMSVVRGKG